MTGASRLLRKGVRWIGRRRWIRFGVRNRLARFVHDPDRAPADEFAVPFYGQRYVGNFASFIDWSVYYFGAYSEAELELLGRILAVRGGGCCLDVGANVGHHTLFLASRAASVIALSPCLHWRNRSAHESPRTDCITSKWSNAGWGRVPGNCPSLRRPTTIRVPAPS
jgi:hypothetical protein